MQLRWWRSQADPDRLRVLPRDSLGVTVVNKTTPNSKKVQIITQFYPPDYAATGQLIEELAHHLGYEDMQVRVFTSQPSYAFDCRTAPHLESCSDQLLVWRSRAMRFWSQRIRGKTLGGAFFFMRSAMHLLRAKHRRGILLLTTAPPFLPVLGYLTHLIFRMPYVCLIYDLYPDIAIELDIIKANNWLIKCWNWCNCQTWKRAQAVVVLCETMKHRVIEKCPTIQDQVTVIHNWANPQQIKPIPKSENWFAHQSKLVDRFTVLYSGNMGRCHDLDTILGAVQHLRNDPIKFVFIGDGAKRQPFMDQCIHLGLNNVLFLPYQSREVLPYSLTACDLSLVSIHSGMEGLVAPSKLYSALNAGRPIAAICEPHSYLRTLIAQAQCGASFMNGDDIGLADFIRYLSQDIQFAKTLGHAGRCYSLAHFTPAAIAKQYSHILNQHSDRHQRSKVGDVKSV